MRILLTFLGMIYCMIYTCKTKGEIECRKDYAKNKITFYYVVNKQKKDSISLLNLNFKLDSLKRINDSTWYYAYSTRAGSNLKIRKNLFFQAINSKIKIVYVGYLIYSYQIDEKYTESQKNNLLDKETYINLFYIPDKSLFSLNPKIVEYYYKGSTLDNGSGKKTQYLLKYDNRNHILYNKIDYLNGTYEIIDSHSLKKEVIKGKAYFLKFQYSELVYFKNNWYEFNRNKSLVLFE